MPQDLTLVTQNPMLRYGQSLPPQQRSKHRAWIGVKVEAELHGYFKVMPSDVVWSEMMRGWMEQLEAFTEPEIRNAFSKWKRENPDRRCNEGHIRHLCELQRKVLIQKAAQRKAPEPKPDRVLVTEEQKKEIYNEIGYTPRRFA